VQDEQLRKFVNSLDSRLDQLVPDNSPFSRGWTGRVHRGVEYVAFSPVGGSITIDLSGEEGSWRLFDWDPSTSSAPVDRGARKAGNSLTWSVRRGAAGVRAVREF
jgi:hypothetical protein